MSQPQGQPPSYQQSGYAPPPGQQSHVVVVNQPQPQIVAIGTCSHCGMGHVTDNFTVLGIILAICFFPIGILCCFLLMEKRCDRCGVAY